MKFSANFFFFNGWLANANSKGQRQTVKRLVIVDRDQSGSFKVGIYSLLHDLKNKKNKERKDFLNM